MSTGQIVLLMVFFAVVIILLCLFSIFGIEEQDEEQPELLEIPDEHIYNMDDNKEYYTEETITRPILIKTLNNNGINGISKLKKSELLEKMYEMHIPFPEVENE